MNSLEVKNLLKRNQVIEQLTDRLKESDSTITELKSEVTQLRNCLKTLQNENFELKSQLSLQNKNYTNFASNGNNGDVLDNMIEVLLLKFRLLTGFNSIGYREMDKRKAS